MTMTLEPQSQLVQIKGVREGLLVTLGEGAWADLRQALLSQVEEQGSFFKGARVAIDVGSQALSAVDLGSLRDALSDREISLWAILSSSAKTELTAQVLGLATRLSAPRAERIIRSPEPQVDGESALIVRRTLRSGIKVTSPGHVVVLGDVNPGAEVEAGGSVVIWGRLKGSVHAGKDGDEDATVSALDYQPTQLRIGEVVAQPGSYKKKNQPQTAQVRSGQISIEIWNWKGK
jgi:septum site-determining protein MinC